MTQVKRKKRLSYFKLVRLLIVLGILLLGICLGAKFYSELNKPQEVAVVVEETPEPTATPTQTPVPTPTPEPIPEPERMYLGQNAYLIETPSPQGEAIKYLLAGEEVIVLEKGHENYYLCQYEGLEGYINKKYLSETEPAETISENTTETTEIVEEVQEESQVENVEQTQEYTETPADEYTEETYTEPDQTSSWDGQRLNPTAGVVYGPSGKESYYNLPMDGVINIMRGMGNYDEYWVREDGAKMLGDYVMVAANLDVYPRGSIVESSLGPAIVCDTGGFAYNGSGVVLDIATNWQ